jgi:hypothetical protein
MKSIWRRKWLVAVIAVAIFLSVGAVAWAATGDDPVATDEATAATSTTGASAASTDSTDIAESLIAGLAQSLGDGSGTPADRAAAATKAVRARGEKWLQRQAAIMEKLRESMSASDQALYDKLVENFKQQREALKEARKNLADTVKQLRDLRDKYLPATTSTTT